MLTAAVVLRFGFWCERFPWGRKYSGVMLLITAAIVLANLRIIPTVAPVYDDGRAHQAVQEVIVESATVRQILGQHDGYHVLLGIDPEDCRGQAIPGILAVAHREITLQFASRIQRRCPADLDQ